MAMSVRAMLWLWSVAVIQCLSPGMAEQKKLYIVHTKHQAKPLSYATHSDWYAATLQSEESLIYTYGTAYHGFAAALDANQAESLRGSPFVLGVYEDIVYFLHTTRTSQFLGLETNLFRSWHGRKSTQGLDQASREVIIGVLDTGVWPESKSFDDTGMPAVPQRWKGACESGPGFSSRACNKKLIGARSFSKGYSFGSKRLPRTPRDTEGHGTHTASTAAGSPVAGASLFGYANGTARGVSPWSRVAAYKVCGKEGCFGADILAGMERAIQDGVDVLSLSLGGGGSGGYYRDPIAIGAFAAMERGIFVSCSAGNGGPRAESLANVAPWVTTVGAGTLDRDFPAYVSLGNGNRLPGVSLYSGRGINRQVSLFYAKGNSSLGGGNLCLPGSLDSVLVRGKVVLCDRGVNARVEKGAVVRDAGGVGMILANTAESGGEAMVADSHLLPAVAVGMTTGDWIRTYARSVKNPTAVLSFAGTVLNVRPSPVVASFSSRGPNTLTPEILKPDVIGPGVNILAAWSGAVGPSEVDSDTRRTQFNIVSGTSMSCPHISGVAALLKAAHPEWSPSAIKSAMMTTAYTLDNTRSPLRDSAVGLHYNSNPWAHGSGHVDPTKAISPGLVYDAAADDYLAFLCSLGYTPSQVAAVAKRHNVTCMHRLADPGHLNYPSFSVLFRGSRKLVTYTRVLTNVGASRSGYRLAVDAPPGVAIRVRPKVLVFRSLGEKKTYTVTFVANGTRGPTTSNAFGSISWVNREHQVTSPVAFSWSTL